MKLHLKYFVLFLILIDPVAFSQAPNTNNQSIIAPTQNQIKVISDWLVSKRIQYETTNSDLSANDLKKISDLVDQPALAFSVIDELIALAEVREPPPETIGFFAARRVSPVVRVLVEIGKPALPKIDQTLARKDLPVWSQVALKDARGLISGEMTGDTEMIFADDTLVLPREVRDKKFVNNTKSDPGSETVKNKISEVRSAPKRIEATVQNSKNIAPEEVPNLIIPPWIWLGACVFFVIIFFIIKRKNHECLNEPTRQPM